MISRTIRPAVSEDLPTLLGIYRIAQRFMAATGNPNQWQVGYPTEAMLRDDIAKGLLYVVEEDGVPHAAFYFFIGDDPTYALITDGSWGSSLPYGTIHRIASDGVLHGVLSTAVTFCLSRIGHLRIDTHADNRVMQHCILKNGFTRRGIIFLANGSPRIAYELLKTDGEDIR